MSIISAFNNEQEVQLIDYDIRNRGTAVETNQSKGLEAINTVNTWLNKQLSSTADTLSAPISIKTEVMLYTQASITTQSNWVRELCFVTTHAIHHLAIMVAIAKLADEQVDHQYGIAPATATYFRQIK